MAEWQPIESAPRDGTVIDLWMVDEDGSEWREADAYWVTNYPDDQTRYDSDGKISKRSIRRDGWFAPNHDYDGEDGFADMPRWFNDHPRQRKWVGRSATHWQPLPEPPTTKDQGDKR